MAVEAEGITGCIAGRAIYEGKLDFAAAVKLAAGEALSGAWAWASPSASFPASTCTPAAW